MIVAGLGRHDLVEAFVVPLVEGDDAFALVTDVDPDLVADDAEHLAGDDLVDFLRVALFRQPTFGKDLVEFLQFLVQEVILP